MGLKILGTGLYLPEKVVTNEDYTKIVETSDGWIVKRTGMKERRITGEPTWVMAKKAAENALENAGLSPLDIDLILCTTVTSDYITPSLACIVQGAIGAKTRLLSISTPPVQRLCTRWIWRICIWPTAISGF